jgi:acyl dehydratase
MFDTSKIGYSFPPFTVTIERTKIRELVNAIGDDNPVYQSQQAAQAAGYPDVPLPPTIATTFLFWGNTHFIEQLAELGLDINRLMHREEEYEYLAPMQPGETLTGIMTVLDGASRRGLRNTSIDLVTLQIRYTNQQTQPVLIATTRLVSRA